MIVIERTVDLSKPISTETLRGNEFTGEARGHQFRISVVQDGEPVTLTGSISAKMLLANGDGLELSSLNSATAIEDGVAVVTLVQACYGVPGRFHLGIYHTLTTSGVTDTTCIYSCVGSVVNATGDPEYSPGAPIGNLETLFEEAETASAAAESALAQATAVVSYAEQTTQTDAQKAQARTNIGAADSAYIAVEPITLDTAGYYTINGTVGSTVDMTVQTSTTAKHAVVNCSPGDQFTVSGMSGAVSPVFAFLDANNVLLSAGGCLAVHEYYVVTAPPSAAKVILQNTSANLPRQVQYKGVYIPGTLDRLESTSNTRTPPVAYWTNGGIDSTGFINSSTNKRSCGYTFRPGERLVVTNTNKDVSIVIYASKDGVFKPVGASGYVTGGGRFELRDWEWAYYIRLAPFSGSTRPDPATGGYINITIESDRVPHEKGYFKWCNYPQIGIHRTYTNIKPMLTFEAKTIDSSGISASDNSCLVTLPNSGWVEVKQDAQSVQFKIAKVAANGTITFPVSDWSYYTHRYEGDGESTYYALVTLSPGATSGVDVMVFARKYLGVYIYTDEGAAYDNGYALSGKKIAFIGDSITQGRFDKDGDSSHGLDTTTSKPFTELVAEVAGDDNVGNYGIGGALVSGNEWKSLLTNCGKVTGYDIVFVCGGTNDYGNNAAQATFEADLHTVVTTLMAANTEVVLCTPIYRTSKRGPNTVGLWLSDYANLIKAEATAQGIKCIDLLALTSDGCMMRFCPDGLHPNEMGHKVMADWIVKEYDRLSL